MPNITWNEASPADVDQVSGGDDAIRSLKTAIRVGLDSEHVWPSAGGDAGVHRIGSARAYYAAQSLVSSSGTDGRIMVASDTSRLFHVGSAGTMFLGGANTPSIGSAPVGGQRFFWAIETGENKIASAGQLVVTLPNSGFSGAPFVTLTTFDPTDRKSVV